MYNKLNMNICLFDIIIRLWLHYIKNIRIANAKNKDRMGDQIGKSFSLFFFFLFQIHNLFIFEYSHTRRYDT